MTVKDLREVIKHLPDEMYIEVSDPSGEDWYSADGCLRIIAWLSFTGSGVEKR